ncbi:hypothetical protein V1477_007307 [Vespula maculifrons]|uniref:Uncharacterized protein n=1 Tax=Vespula maculifrons TaxID=7453 RepID=A0ABD2CI62_VESMC
MHFEFVCIYKYVFILVSSFPCIAIICKSMSQLNRLNTNAPAVYRLQVDKYSLMTFIDLCQITISIDAFQLTRTCTLYPAFKKHFVGKYIHVNNPLIVQPSHERVIAKLQFKCELQTCELDLAKHMKFCIWILKILKIKFTQNEIGKAKHLKYLFYLRCLTMRLQVQNAIIAIKFGLQQFNWFKAKVRIKKISRETQI